MEEVRELLENNNDVLHLEDHELDNLATHLESIGVMCLQDLRDVRKGNLVGLKLEQRKNLMQRIEKQVKCEPTPAFSGGIWEFMVSACLLQDHVASTLQIHLHDTLGVDTVADLAEVDGPDVTEGAGLTIIEQNRFLRCIDEQLKSPEPKKAVEAKTTSSEEGDSSTQVQPPNHIKVRYIYCSNLFAKGVRETVLTKIDPLVHTMGYLYSIIGENEGIGEETTIEIFSHEGYPLNVTDFTVSCSLSEWFIKDEDLFYVFPRLKVQPGIVEMKPLPHLDHTLGRDELYINSQLYGSFTIKADLDTDSAEDIVQKVSDYTKVPTPNIILYARRNFQPLDIYTELFNGDKITMVLKDPGAHLGNLTATYGKKTYNMMQPQSDWGVSKFYSILRFLCLKQKETVKFPNLLAYLRELTRCPPIVYALSVLYENSFLSLPCWVALIEGFYQLFRSWLATFLEDVEDSRVFEFSDYFWALLINKAETETADTSCEKTELISLICPISELRITDPVSIWGSRNVFDRQSVLERIERGEPVEEHQLNITHLKPDLDTARLLMYNPWATDKDTYRWKNLLSASQKQEIPQILLPCNWYELASLRDCLHINAPDVLFGLESLTFVEQGRLVLFMGFTKDTEVHHTLYDPVECDYVKRRKCELQDIVKGSDAPSIVSKDLTKLVKTLILLSPEKIKNARPKPIISRNPEALVDWEPKEAIVVVLDRSGSMGSSIFNGELQRLAAAKVFFGAFALRTQAYNFHHSVGLTVFDSNVTQRMRLTKMSPSFELTLGNVDVAGQTALNGAMANAADQLREYTKQFPKCCRRILCLTDGCENASAPIYQSPYAIASYLKTQNVIVDTVLIDNTAANVVQKAITHATGGACFRPTTLSEGQSLFEMETFLSLRARELPNLPFPTSVRELKQFESIHRFPFNTGELPSSLFCYSRTVNTLSLHKILDKYSEIQSQVQGKTTNCTKRVMKELRSLRQNPIPGIEIFPSDTSVTIWKVLIKGPQSTPYAGGLFVLFVNFPVDYPSKPPEVNFLTPIYHCNINSNGRICHQVFTLGYKPRLTMRDILACVYGLLMCPEPTDPLDSIKGLELFHSLKKGSSVESTYESNAKRFTEVYAKKFQYADLKKALSGE